MPEAELFNQMKYLFMPRQKILNKENPKVPKCEPNEKITVNLSFSNNHIKCNFVPAISHKKKAGKDKSEVEKAVEKETKIERQNVLDAVIVRIMKVSPL